MEVKDFCKNIKETTVLQIIKEYGINIQEIFLGTKEELEPALLTLQIHKIAYSNKYCACVIINSKEEGKN